MDEGPCSPACLNGALCVNSTCLCETTRFPTRDDVTIFNTGNTCGLVVPAMVSSYVLTMLIALAIGIMSLFQSRKQTKPHLRRILVSNAVASTMTGVFAASHWAEGYTIGPVTIVIMLYTLLHINAQVAYMDYLMFSILIKASPRSEQRITLLKKWLVCFNAFWVTMKVLACLVVFASTFVNDVRFYNVSMLVLVSTVLIEVMSQSLMAAFGFRRIYANLMQARAMAQKTGTHSEAQRNRLDAFASKMLGQMRIVYQYGLLILVVSIVIIVLFIVFDEGQIPYSWIFFAVYSITWPLLCLGPIFLLEESVVRENDKPTTSDEESPIRVTPATGQVSPASPKLGKPFEDRYIAHSEQKNPGLFETDNITPRVSDL